MAEVAPAAVSQARVAVSNTKKPLFFYVNLAKKLLAANGSVELSALGLASPTVVTVAEILKNNGLVETKRIQTSAVDVTLDNGRTVQKAHVEITLAKSAKFDEILAATQVNHAADEETKA